MKTILASISVLFGVIASILVFTPYFKTPPIPILIFAVLGIIAGLYSVKEMKVVSSAGLLLSVASFGYLVTLYIQLGG